MSRPYLKINSATFSYAADLVTLDLTALRIRGGTSFTLDGFSSSQTITLTDGHYNNSSYTFSAVLDGSTSSTTTTTTYVAPTTSITFGGTASGAKTTLLPALVLPGPSYYYMVGTPGGYTFSATQSLATALETLVATMSFTGAGAGFSATVSGNTIVFSGPWGAYYNGPYGVQMMYPGGVNYGTLGQFTFSSTYNETAAGFVSGSFSGGTTTFALTLSNTNFGTLDSNPFTI